MIKKIVIGLACLVLVSIIIIFTLSYYFAQPIIKIDYEEEIGVEYPLPSEEVYVYTGTQYNMAALEEKYVIDDELTKQLQRYFKRKPVNTAAAACVTLYTILEKNLVYSPSGKMFLFPKDRDKIRMYYSVSYDDENQLWLITHEYNETMVDGVAGFPPSVHVIGRDGHYEGYYKWNVG